MAHVRATDRNRASRRLVIIGAGFSGAAAAVHVLRGGKAAPHVTLVERTPVFGPGLAYGAAAGAHLLNTPADRMSAIEDDPQHFARWLDRRAKASAVFASRARYGAYVQETLAEASRSHWPSRLARVRGAAIACRRSETGWIVRLASGRTLAADAVILALGHHPPSAPAPFQAADVIGAWNASAQARLPRAGDVLLLGTGLTMMDVAIALCTRKREGVVYALSRRGRLPYAQTDAPAPACDAGEPPLELSAALNAFRRRAGEDWRAALDALRPATSELWARLGAERQARFLRHLRPWWDSHRHRAPPETATQFAALQTEGRVRILAGEIVSAACEAGAWRLQHRPRGGRVRRGLDVVGVINCTGSDLVLARSGDPLVRQMLDEGLVRAPANGLGVDVDPHNRPRDKSGAAHADLFLLGPLAAGAFWETTAAPEIRARAAAIARLLG